MVHRPPREQSGQQRAERSLERAYVFLRLGQYVPAGLTVVFAAPSVYLHRELVLWLYFATAAWSAFLLVAMLRGWPIKQIGAVIDVVLISFALVVVGRFTVGHALGWANWLAGPAFGASLIALVFGRKSLAVPSLLVLVACYLIGVWPTVTSEP